MRRGRGGLDLPEAAARWSVRRNQAREHREVL
ncbi:MAG: hypothetical protein QOF20_725, partial [Acidimicrobiaceae bacterium]|nr:hypothetical protein [Acidimicrobiaceae bacterium]